MLSAKSGWRAPRGQDPGRFVEWDGDAEVDGDEGVLHAAGVGADRFDGGSHILRLGLRARFPCRSLLRFSSLSKAGELGFRFFSSIALPVPAECFRLVDYLGGFLDFFENLIWLMIRWS